MEAGFDVFSITNFTQPRIVALKCRRIVGRAGHKSSPRAVVVFSPFWGYPGFPERMLVQQQGLLEGPRCSVLRRAPWI